MATADYLLSNRSVAKARYVIEHAMSYKCDIQRPTPTANDGYGHPGAPTWSASLVNQKCLVVSLVIGSPRTGEQQDANTAYALDRYLLYLPYGADVLLTDRLSAIYNRDGTSFDATAAYYEIKERVANEASLVYSIQVIK